MSHSKTGINAPFYKWLDDVRRAMRKEKELQEKLKFYERQLISCKGVSYDRIGSTSTSPNDKDLIYWIDKISITKNQIDKLIKILNQISEFDERLINNEKILFRSILFGLLNTEQHSSMIFNMNSTKASLIRKWFRLNQNSFSE